MEHGERHLLDRSVGVLKTQHTLNGRTDFVIEIVCHRGANEYAPENTYPSAEKCIAWGVEYVEIDVNTSRDGVMYLFHGPDVGRRTDGTGMFYDLTSTIINTLDAGSWFSPKFAYERIPRLDEFLNWIKGKSKVYFDVKRADHEQLLTLIREVGLENDCFFWSSHSEWSQKLKEIAPEFPVKLNVRHIEDVRDVHQKYGADIVEVSLNNMSTELQNCCADLGIKVMIYHKEKDPEAFRKIINWNVDMINLNHADAFIEVAQEMGIR
jgi:glycerophosphoryl diester phosphodiesterase